MTHEETSLRTKQALADSLKKLMSQKPFSKITISELIKDCNVNRKTFYYHFEDIYGLLKWVLEQETFEVLKQFDLLVDYQDAFEYVLNYVEQNSFFLNCIYDSIGRDEMKRFLYHDFVGVVGMIVSETEKKANVTISEEYRFFLIELYTEGIAGMMINIFQHPKQYKKDKLIEYLAVLINTSIPAAVSKAL